MIRIVYSPVYELLVPSLTIDQQSKARVQWYERTLHVYSDEMRDFALEEKDKIDTAYPKTNIFPRILLLINYYEVPIKRLPTKKV